MSVIRMTVLVGVVLLATACGSQAPSAPSDPSAGSGTTIAQQSTVPSGSSESPTAAAAVPEQLRFTASTVDGASFDAANLAGRPAVLWFWAPWCPTCNAEAPGLREVVGANAGTVTFIGVAGLADVPAMQQLVQKHSLGSFTHLVDADGALWRRFGVTHQPAYAFIDATGKIQVEKHELSKDALASRVAGLAGR
jgi:thiol-disulfide isomerase/thioredoxin